MGKPRVELSSPILPKHSFLATDLYVLTGLGYNIF